MKWLDKRVPDWPSRINLRTFNIKDECRCVLGGVFKKEARKDGVMSYEGKPSGYEWARNNFSELDYDATHGVLSGDEYRGFYVTSTEGPDEYALLQKEWRRVIRERKGLSE